MLPWTLFTNILQNIVFGINKRKKLKHNVSVYVNIFVYIFIFWVRYPFKWLPTPKWQKAP